MLNILTQPTLVVHTDNPVPIEIEAGNDWQYPTPPVNSGYMIEFASTSIVDGDTITFTIKGVKYVVHIMAMGTSISDSGLEAEENYTPYTVEDYLNNVLIPTMKHNYTLSNYLTFSAAPDILFIEGLFEAELSVTTSIAGATVTFGGAGNDAIYPPNYHVILDVLIDSAKIATLKAIPEKASPFAAKFDISDIAKSYVSSELPTFAQTNVTQVTKSSAPCSFVFAEGYGNPVVYQAKNVNLTPFMLLKGGLPFEMFQTYGLTAPIQISRKRSASPHSKIVTTSQQEYIYLFSYFSIFDTTTPVVVNANIYYTDGTNTTITCFEEIFENYKEYIIPAGHDALNLASVNPSKNITKWEIEVISSEYGAMIPTQTYTLPIRCSYNELYFLFENSLNGFDTLRTTTNPVVGFQVSKEEFQKTIAYDYAAANGERTIHNLHATKRVKLSTGWVDFKFIKYLQEFLTSERIYQIDGQFLPVQLIGNSFQLYKNDEQLFALEFEYEYLFESTKYFAQ